MTVLYMLGVPVHLKIRTQLYRRWWDYSGRRHIRHLKRKDKEHW